MRRLVTGATATPALAGAAVAGTADAAGASGLSRSTFCGSWVY